ncbi:MAG TPA: ROK family protein [Polyangia bacterium]|jgi:predicted NBD/HSP70 family sugar kinase|nr:ROK family protein [Polyangia bacterium]
MAKRRVSAKRAKPARAPQRERGRGTTAKGASVVTAGGSGGIYVGIHFGVRATTVGVADASGTIDVVRKQPSLVGSPARSLAAARVLMADALGDAGVSRGRVRMVGATVPGLVDQETGVCVLAPNLGWHDFALRSALADELDVPVAINNVAQAAAVAEGRVGAARRARSYVWVHVGSGVGSGIVLDGRLFFGHRGFSGEIGHCPVVYPGSPCGCGRLGCLETVASAKAIVRAAEAAIAEGEPTVLAELPPPLSSTAVAAAAREGDPVARRILGEASEYLGRGISYLLNVLNPEMVVLGGAIAQAGETLVGPVRASVARHSLLSAGVSVVPSTLGNRAELTGAVFMAIDEAASRAPAAEPVAPPARARARAGR